MKIYLSLFITFFILFSYSESAFAEEAIVENVRVVHGDSVSLTFSINGAFTDDITQAINSGIPTSFTYLVKLYKVRAFFPDKQIKTFKFNHTVKYDNLKKEYIVTLDRKALGQEDVTLRVTDIEEMKKHMTSVEKISFIPNKPFESGYAYRLLVKAELDVVNLPLAVILDYMLFFVKLWDFETNWYEYKFTY